MINTKFSLLFHSLVPSLFLALDSWVEFIYVSYVEINLTLNGRRSVFISIRSSEFFRLFEFCFNLYFAISLAGDRLVIAIIFHFVWIWLWATLLVHLRNFSVYFSLRFRLIAFAIRLVKYKEKKGEFMKKRRVKEDARRKKIENRYRLALKLVSLYVLLICIKIVLRFLSANTCCAGMLINVDSRISIYFGDFF